MPGVWYGFLFNCYQNATMILLLFSFIDEENDVQTGQESHQRAWKSNRSKAGTREMFLEPRY